MSAETLTALATLIASLAAAIVSVITAIRSGNAAAAATNSAREARSSANAARVDAAAKDEKIDQIHSLVNGSRSEALELIAQLRHTIANLTQAARDSAAAERAAVDAGNAPPAKKSPRAHPLTD